jgi:hypothetical protein
MECGAPLESDSEFCAKCGKTVKPITTHPSTPASSGEPKAHVSLPAQKRMKILAVIIIAVLIVSVLFGTGLVQRLFKPPVYAVDSSVKPFQALIPDTGKGPRPLAAFQDEKRVRSTFVENEVIFTPSSSDDLSAFLTRHNGRVISNGTIPAPPQGVKRRPNVDTGQLSYTIRLDPSTFSVQDFADDASRQGFNGTVKTSSDNAAKLLALVLHEQASGTSISPNFVNQRVGYIYSVTKDSWNGNLSPGLSGPSTNAMNWLVFNDTAPILTSRGTPYPELQQCTDGTFTWHCAYGRTGSNVYKAWQFVAAHGFHYRPKVAIIDGGFWLDPNGNVMGLPGHPWQYDFDTDVYVAYGAILGGYCSQNNPCPFHGYEAALTAMGAFNSGLTVGTGGQVADPILFISNGWDEDARAVRTAISWGADIISMSWGGDCNHWCRHWAGGPHSLSSALDDASKAGLALFAAVGNNSEGDTTYFPCLKDKVECVGALDDGKNRPAGYSNYGSAVKIWAPAGLPQPSIVCTDGSDKNPDAGCAPGKLAAAPNELQAYYGTSAATPFVAGVAAMMKAINPRLTGTELWPSIYGNSASPLEEAYDSRVDNDGNANFEIYWLDAFASVIRAAGGYNVGPDVHIVYPAHGASINPNGNFNGRTVGTFEAWAYDIWDSDAAIVPFGLSDVGGNPMRDDTYNTSPPPHNLPSWAKTEPSQYSWSIQPQGTPPSAPPVTGSGYVQPDPNSAFPLKSPWVTMTYYDFTQQQKQQQDYMVTVKATNSHNLASSDSIRVHVGFANNPPQPVITQPSSSSWSGVLAEMGVVAAYPAGVHLMLQGHAKSTDPGELGWVPCDHMEFSGAGANTFQQTPTATVDYQQTGVCQTLASFPDPGSEQITLDAWNQFKQHGQAWVRIELVEETSSSSSSSNPGQSNPGQSNPGQSNPTSEFDFELNVPPDAQVVTQGSSVSLPVTVQVAPGSTTSATITLSIPPIMSIPKPPQDLTTSFTTTSGVPTFQSQLTIKTSDFTAAKTYMITIKASGGGHIHTKIVKVEVLSLPH